MIILTMSNILAIYWEFCTKPEVLRLALSPPVPPNEYKYEWLSAIRDPRGRSSSITVTLVTLLQMDDAQPDVQIPRLNVDRAQALLAPPAVLPQEPRQEQAVAAPPAVNQPAPAPQQASELEVIYRCNLLSVYKRPYFPFCLYLCCLCHRFRVRLRWPFSHFTDI